MYETYADPFAGWGAGGSHQAEPDTTAYAAMQGEAIDSGTDSDTSSDEGCEVLPDPGAFRMNEADAAKHVYMMYCQAKETWRRFTGKPARHFRRTIKHVRKGKGKGKGKGKIQGSGFFWTHDDTLVYLYRQR